jgi:putative ABC transport system permease protein
MPPNGNDSQRCAGSGSARGSIRSILLVTEVALALVLVIRAGLLIRSLSATLGVNPGFNPDHLRRFHPRSERDQSLR